VRSRFCFQLLTVALLAYPAKSATGAPRGATLRFDLPPAPPEPSPAPEREPDEHARRSWEIAPRLGLVMPLCRGDQTGLARCESTGSGDGLGLHALWRVAPYVALGVQGDFARFTIDADTAEGSARSIWVGAAVRGYFLERGFLDPYAETGFGRGSVDTIYDVGGTLVSVHGSGAATMVGAGLDFWISSRVKVGPAIAYYWTFLGDVRVCSGAVCSTSNVGSTGAVASHANFSVALSLALGPEM
jgi:hypothetical protein